MTELLPCPHCGGDPSLREKTEVSGYDEYRRYIDLCYVACSVCGARTKDVIKGSFANFTNFTEFTVQDLRENPELRAPAQAEYEEYLQALNKIVHNLWNMRH